MLLLLAHSSHTAFFFFNDTATTEIYTLSLHDALPISFKPDPGTLVTKEEQGMEEVVVTGVTHDRSQAKISILRSEEHTSELQSRLHLVCRLLLEKKKNTTDTPRTTLTPRTHLITPCSFYSTTSR